MLCIKNGLVHTAVDPEALVQDILVENGKIIAIGTDLDIPEGTEIMDVSG